MSCEDWDPPSPSKEGGGSNLSVGIGSGSRSGIGRGYSKVPPKQIDSSQPSFGSSAYENKANDSDWPGGNDSEFGSSQNRSSNYNDGSGDGEWNPKGHRNDSSSSRRGYNNRSEGGNDRACYSCGKEGHRKSECPDAGSGGNRRGCYNCGDDGHMSRDCPKPKVDRRGGGGGKCYKCNEEGHISRDCPNSDSGASNYRGGSGGNKCYKCNEEGHMSRECPNSDSSSNNRGGGGGKCYKCNEPGHMSRECPNAESSGGGDRKCYKCNGEGHMAKDCTEQAVDQDGKPRPPPYIPVDLTDNEEHLFDGISSGINFDKYEAIKVNVSGKDAPPAINSFDEANIRELLKVNISKAKYKKPTPVQKHCIPIVLANRDLMACAQTGSGKTAAFMVPIVNAIMGMDLESGRFQETQEPLAVILSPTRELAIQIYSEAKKFAYNTIVKSVVIYGGTSTGYQMRQLSNGCHILVATPGRLVDFVEKGKVSFSRLKFLVLDEADRMLDMGFIGSIRTIVEHPTTPNKTERHTLMFSATFPVEIQGLAKEFLDSYIFVAVGEIGAANQDVEQTVYAVSKYEKPAKLEELLRDATSKNQKVLVFVETKRNADYVASLMCQKGFPTTSIHGDRMQREREEALSDFRSGKFPVLIATAVAARGLDIKNVANVVNYDLPQSIDEYVHRIGRTGRVGNTGKAISFYDSEQNRPLARPLIKILTDATQVVPEFLEADGSAGGHAADGGYSGFGASDIRTSNDDWGNNNSVGGQFGVEESWE